MTSEEADDLAILYRLRGGSKAYVEQLREALPAGKRLKRRGHGVNGVLDAVEDALPDPSEPGSPKRVQEALEEFVRRRR